MHQHGRSFSSDGPDRLFNNRKPHNFHQRGHSHSRHENRSGPSDRGDVAWEKQSYADLYGKDRERRSYSTGGFGHKHHRYQGESRDRGRSREKENVERARFSTEKGLDKSLTEAKPSETLPVEDLADLIAKVVARENIVIFVSETGSGKSTKIPQIILDKVFNDVKNPKIAITQPRRVAALSLATKVAQERRTTVGEKVGYKFRFENQTSPSTELVYLTDGMLIRELTFSAKIPQYNCIVLDEVHERSVNSDILLYLLKRLQESERKDLKLVLMSAHTDVVKLKEYLPGTNAYFIPGRVHPIDTFNIPAANSDYLDLTVRTVVQLHQDTEDLSHAILVFLTGQEEIESVCESIRNHCKDLQPVRVVSFYASLGSHRPEVFDASKVRPGFGSAGRWYAHEKRLDQLVVQLVSKAQAIQRAGRAGRTGPGQCYRLYTEEEYAQMPDQTVPEVARTNLSQLVLQLLSLNLNLNEVQLLDQPRPAAWLDALYELYAMKLIQMPPSLSVAEPKDFYGMTDEQRLHQRYQLTSSGHKVAHLPVSPIIGHFLIVAESHRCLNAAIKYAAVCCASEEPFKNVKGCRAEDKVRIEEDRAQFIRRFSSDHAMLTKLADKCNKRPGRREDRKDLAYQLRVNEKFVREVRDIRKQIKVACQKAKFSESPDHASDEDVQKALSVPDKNNMNQFGRPPLPDPDKLAETSWSNPQRFPPNMLCRENVIHYFADPSNPFYDRQSDNEQLKMQVTIQQWDDSQLVRMTGIQYVLHDGQPPLFIIRKQRRQSPTVYSPIAFYYVLNGVVYQAPSLYNVVQSRITGAVEPLKRALNETLQHLKFNVAKGYYWNFDKEQAFKKDADDGRQSPRKREEEPWNTRATPYQHNRTEMLLALLKEEFSEEKPRTAGTNPNSAAATPPRAGTPGLLPSREPPTFLAPAAPAAPPSAAHTNQALDLPPILPNPTAGAHNLVQPALPAPAPPPMDTA